MDADRGWALKPGEERDPWGWGIRCEYSGLLPSTPCRSLEVHEAYAKSVPLASGEQEPQTDQPPWHSLPKCCICGLQEAASQPCTVTVATAVLRLLKARVGERREVEKAHGGFSGKTHLFLLPRKSIWKGVGKKGKNGHLGSRESRARKDFKMLQEQLSRPEVLPFFMGEASKRTKVWAGLCAGAMCWIHRRSCDPRPGWSSPGRCLSATAGFLLGRAINLNGVLPHCVFLLLEDPGRVEGILSAS